MASVSLKVLIVGDAGVGKTTFVDRHRTGQFSPKYIATMGSSVSSLTFQTNKGLFILNMWDIAGVEKFRADHLTSASKEVDACIIMFDVVSLISYKNLKFWFDEVRRLNGEIPIVICGNKVDLRERVVRPKDIDFHRRHGLQYYDISAKSNYNFEKPFLYILQKKFGKDLVFTETAVLSVDDQQNKLEIEDIKKTQEALKKFEERYQESVVRI